MQLTPDEIEVVKKLIADHGSDCPSLSIDELRPLAEKLGVWEPEVPPTTEELARWEAFANSKAGQQLKRLMEATNKFAAESIAKQILDKTVFDGPDWGGDTTQLRVRLPKDYIVKKSGA